MLQQVHDKGVIHRDVKPDNVIVLSDPLTTQADCAAIDVRLSDFGCAWFRNTNTRRRVYFEGSSLCASERALKGKVPRPKHDLVPLTYSLFSLAHPGKLKDGCKPKLADVVHECAKEEWCVFLTAELEALGQSKNDENDATMNEV